MESNESIKPRHKIPIIFGLITSYRLHEILEKNDAKLKETKAVFLIKDSLTYPGLTTISYYSQEDDTVKNIRFGLTVDGWKMAPKPPKEPKLTDSLEVKGKYKQDKAKFDMNMNSFLNTAKALFEQDVTFEQIKSLAIELKKNDFRLEGLIKPSSTQASQEKHYSNYMSYVFVLDEKPDQSNSPY